MKKRLRYLGGLFLAILVLYLQLDFGTKWWRTAFLVVAALVCFCGVLFPDIPDQIAQLLFRGKKDE